MEDNEGDINANHVGLNVGSPASVAVGNVSAMNLVLKKWDEAEGLDRLRSKFKEIRSEGGWKGPLNPIIAQGIDLLRIWGGRDVFAGMTSSNRGASAQIINVYSKRMHSVPADPGDERVRTQATNCTALAADFHDRMCCVDFILWCCWCGQSLAAGGRSLLRISGFPAKDAKAQSPMRAHEWRVQVTDVGPLFEGEIVM